MLTTEDIERMVVEIATGKKSTLHTPEAVAMRAQLTREIADIKARGGGVQPPFEIKELPE